MRNRILSCLFLILIPVFGCAQIERISYKKASFKFKNLYNSGRHQDVFKMLSSDMKAQFPLEKVIINLNNFKNKHGLIKALDFIGYNEKNTAIYIANFKNTRFKLFMHLADDKTINKLFFEPYKILKTALALPFKEEWTVGWGGDTATLNYHVASGNKAQKHALDLLITDEQGKPYQTNGAINTDYYAFGKSIIAPCDAEVVLAVDGIKDNKIGLTNIVYVAGNSVILKTKNSEYLLFAHLKQFSVAVEQGQQVKKGELLGLCGNSGNSSQPHLHFHAQDIEDINTANGIKCFFNKVFVNQNLEQNYAPIKGDQIKN